MGTDVSFKPGYLTFLKYQFTIKNNKYLEFDSRKYVESKLSLRITHVVNYVDIALLVVIFSLFELSYINKLIIWLLSGLCVETIHWFCSSFVEKVD